MIEKSCNCSTEKPSDSTIFELVFEIHWKLFEVIENWTFEWLMIHTYMNTFFEWMIRNLYKWFLLFEIRFWEVEEKLISSISRQKFFDIHEENCSLLSSTSPAFIYLKFVCDEMLWAWFWKARYWQHETFLETNWRWGDTNFMSHAPLWVTWVHRIIFFNFWSFYQNRFSIVPNSAFSPG